jgi:hypothetical protein
MCAAWVSTYVPVGLDLEVMLVLGRAALHVHQDHLGSVRQGVEVDALVRLSREVDGDPRSRLFPRTSQVPDALELLDEPPFETPTLYALSTETSKLVEHPGFPGWTELFQLAEYPHETENLASSEEHAATLAALRAELAEHERGIGPRPPGFE